MKAPHPQGLNGGLIVWFTGLSGSGKSTLARHVHAALVQDGRRVELLDADKMRASLSSCLGYERRDREENVRRLGYLAGLLQRTGVPVLVAAMSPYRAGRDEVRTNSSSTFIEVFVDAPLAICEQRDPVGLYRRFRAGEISNLSGLDDPYEPPPTPEVHCRTDLESVERCVRRILAAIEPFLSTGGSAPKPR